MYSHYLVLGKFSIQYFCYGIELNVGISEYDFFTYTNMPKFPMIYCNFSVY